MLTPSSSLPAREGDLESSKGDAKGPIRLSRDPADSELQLVRLESMPPALEDLEGVWSLNRRGLDLDVVGGSSSSVDSAGANGLFGLYGMPSVVCFRRTFREPEVRDLEVGSRELESEEEVDSVSIRLPASELRRMCGGDSCLCPGGKPPGADIFGD